MPAEPFSVTERQPSRRLVVATVLLGTTTVSLNNSSLNPALPAFIDAFNIGPLWATWIVAAFMVSMGITMPLTGYLGDRLGNRRLYLLGTALFIAGSAAGAMAGSVGWVIAARAVQGAASGLMIPLSLTLIFSVYPKGERDGITGLWGAAVMLAPALGPLCGGLLLAWFSWPALFVMNIPVGLLALLLGWRVLPYTAPAARRPFDVIGYLLVCVGVGLLMTVTSRLHHAAALWQPLNLLMLLAALVCLAVFVRVELRLAQPLLNLRIFTLRGYRLSVVIAVVQSVGMFECLVLLPMLVQMVMGYSALWTGLALLATALCASLFGKLGGHWLPRYGAARVVSLGLMLTVLATLGLGFCGAHSSLSALFGWMLLRGAGLGLSYMPVTTAGLNVLPQALVTQGAAMNNISRRLVSSLAIVLASLYLEYRLAGSTLIPVLARASAISEAFIATAVVIALALPCAWRFPSTSDEAAANALLSGTPPVR
ncbi:MULTISPECIES: DHA2 family efflux MFS transporter permease subunit [Dickeya]|uniref:Permease of the major facilitator superfamily in achromobactin biosynthesis operon n=1 Tax=Dickeya aquatica TaxID=1401087 RepID=A0A375A8W8_9GAMM|nr:MULTISPECIES: DHA2 family efflux MFS transporter permease subunit [Dickeya]SLM62483.1 Permease of the major facilitator superfamily in achromobactin biosynthesis operon [Dickeya aquatica]